MRFPSRRRCRRFTRAGMTMVEMIVALSLFAVVSGVIFAFLNGSRGTYGRTRDLAQNQQALRSVISLMTREIRSAGCDVFGAGGFDGIDVADDLQLRCLMDLDGDGSTLGPDEDVTYTYLPGPGELRRTAAGGPPQTILSAQRHGLQLVQFTYFDVQGNPLVNTPLSAEDREVVRFVDIALSVLREGEPVNYVTRVHVRNDEARPDWPDW